MDSDTLEATSASQKKFVFAITELEQCHITELEDSDSMEERDMGIFSTYTQRLKQLGFSLDTLEDAKPAVFLWMSCQLFRYDCRFLVSIRSTLPILLSLGADINARWRGSPPLINFFGEYAVRTDDEEVDAGILIETAIELLENGADILALSDDGLSVFDVAEYVGLASELALALQETGYDLDEVEHNIDWAQWCFDNPGDGVAESTAVDLAHMEEASGLVSRRAIAGDRLEE